VIQLQLPLGPPVGRVPSFLAEDNATLLVIAGQERRRPGGRRQAIAVLRWRATMDRGGRMRRPTAEQLAVLDRIEQQLGGT
jgi:hypothetical protein